MSDRSILSSLRYLFADVIGDDDSPTPFLPEGLPETVVPVASDAIHMLIDYQGTNYAQLYVDRLKRFIGRRALDDAVFAEIARLMAARMSYEDPIRIAQLTLEETPAPFNEVKKFRIDELVGALPAIVAEPVLDTLEWLGWLRLPVSIRFSAANRWGIRRLKIEAGLRRWRLFSVRYPKERAWVERWLHMIDRSLTKQPGAVPTIVQTAAMIKETKRSDPATPVTTPAMASQASARGTTIDSLLSSTGASACGAPLPGDTDARASVGRRSRIAGERPYGWCRP